MGRKSSTVVKESLLELKKWERKTRHTKMNVRVKVLFALKESKFATNGALASYVNTDISTLQRWLKTL